MDATFSRRDVIGGVGAGLLAVAGAGTASGEESGTELVVHSARATPVEVTVTVTNPEYVEPILDPVAVPLGPGGEATVSDTIPRTDGHSVTVEVTDVAVAPARYRWDRVESPLHVVVYPGEVAFRTSDES